MNPVRHQKLLPSVQRFDSKWLEFGKLLRQQYLLFWQQRKKDVNSVDAKTNSSLEWKRIGIGGGAHIVHNAINTAADCPPVEFEYDVEIYHLHEVLKMLWYRNTRCLALMRALEKILKMSQFFENTSW